MKQNSTSKKVSLPSIKESLTEKKARARAILRRLLREFPQARTALKHENPFQLLVATILSAQCTDERVNMVTPALFRKYPDARAFARTSQEELEGMIRSTGFFRMKAKNILACSKALADRFGGEVPRRMEDMVTLPGVGRKTANVVLGQAFGVVSGVVVDTHVHRLAQRMGLTREDTPEKVERDLMEVYPKKSWIDVGNVFILHGRKTCPARSPRCAGCCINDLCPSAGMFLGGAGRSSRSVLA
jgi:endonuclease-3